MAWVTKRFGAFPEALVAAEVSLKCGAAMHSVVRSSMRVEYKGGSSSDDISIDPVTETDRANEALAVKTLLSAFPSHLVIGEESSAESGVIPSLTDAPTWIIDPIDGTTNFTHGAPLAAVSIGLCVDRTPTIGVVYDPYNDELHVGVRGGGAYRNGERIDVDASTRTLPQALVLVDPGYERSAEGVHKYTACTSALLLANVQAIRVIGSAVLSICYVASGRANAYFAGIHLDDTPKPWDWCAAYVIASEAGATFSRLDDRGYDAVEGGKGSGGGGSGGSGSTRPFDVYSKSCLVAASPVLRDELQSLVRRACTRT